MNQRVLSVSLSHVIRTIATLLLPIAFLSLIAWATAGSASGSTTDPIRGATWIWMGLHHVPFQLAFPPANIPGYLRWVQGSQYVQWWANFYRIISYTRFAYRPEVWSADLALSIP